MGSLIIMYVQQSTDEEHDGFLLRNQVVEVNWSILRISYIAGVKTFFWGIPIDNSSNHFLN